jgi:hypothetical protein
MPVKVAIDKQEQTLTITMPLQSARASASGKTKVIASTHGCHVTDLKRLGRPIVVSANAFIYSNGQPKEIVPNETGAGSATRREIKSAKDRRSKITAVVSGKSRHTQNPKTRPASQLCSSHSGDENSGF